MMVRGRTVLEGPKLIHALTDERDRVSA
jgi:hypothetical protein